MPGIPIGDVWTDIPDINSQAKERLGYPTQKPEALLERIIKASSNEGDVVLDPFCGCGTTITVAERLKRHWIGIDITYLAINLIKRRLHDTFSPEELAAFEVIGVPADATSAAALAEENRHQFEWWALDMVEATPAQDKKKGADRGVDGVLYFQEKDDGPYHKIIVQVKSGHVGAKEVRELEGHPQTGKGGDRHTSHPEAAYQTHERSRARRLLCFEPCFPTFIFPACKSSPSPNCSPGSNWSIPAGCRPRPSRRRPAATKGPHRRSKRNLIRNCRIRTDRK